MKTREELLMTADVLLDWARRHAQHAHEGNEADAAIASGIALTAQACIAIAKELREAEQAPTYEQMLCLVKAVQALELR